MGGIAVTKREKFKMRGAFRGVGFFWFWNLDIYEVNRRRRVSEFQSFNGKTDGFINVSKVTRKIQNTMLAFHFLWVHLVDLQILLAQK